VQTFASIWWLHIPTKKTAFIIIGVEWIFVILFVGIGFGVHTHAPSKYYATPTPYWCWLGQSFKAERIAGEYVWFWLTLLVSFSSYLPLFLLHYGIIEEGSAWYAPTVEAYTNDPDRDKVKSKAFSRTPAKLWTAIVYPIVYCLVILPCSIIRWIGFRQEAISGESHISPVVTFVFAVLFTLSGVFNSVIYPLTRPRIFERTSAQAPSHRAEEKVTSESGSSAT